MILIAAADLNNGTGLGNNLLYDIPEDKKFFREKTTGGTVVMGRKTYESLPVKPLPNRQNIVITTRRDAVFDGALSVHSVEELLKAVAGMQEDKVFVAGGSEIYSLFLPYCTTALITKIYSVREADHFLPDFDTLEGWHITSASELKKYNGISFRFLEYSRKKPGF